jgi:hypothetical protein
MIESITMQVTKSLWDRNDIGRRSVNFRPAAQFAKERDHERDATFGRRRWSRPMGQTLPRPHRRSDQRQGRRECSPPPRLR